MLQSRSHNNECAESRAMNVLLFRDNAVSCGDEAGPIRDAALRTSFGRKPGGASSCVLSSASATSRDPVYSTNSPPARRSRSSCDSFLLYLREV